MFFLNLNKTGLWTMLVLLLLGLSLYPACGRPSFVEEDEDTVADEDHEEDEDQVDVQDEDEDIESDPTTTESPTQRMLRECQEAATAAKLAAEKWADAVKKCLDKGKDAQNKRGGGGGGTTADEYDD